MFGLAKKKDVFKEFEKVKTGFRKRDSQINSLKHKIIYLQKEIVSRKEIELMIREYLVQSEPNPAPKSEPDKRNYERVMVKKAIKSRPKALKEAIKGCLERGMRTTDIFRLIVEEKKIISKTQFYHYLALVRQELRTPVRTELRTKEK